MYKYPLIAFVTFFSVFLHAEAPTYGDYFEDHPDLIKRIESFSFCEDEEIPEFNGDITVILDDGSEWKVYPDNQQKMSYWHPEDHVYIEPRTSTYFFKREHKFRLVNLDRDRESVKVMYIREPTDPLIVVGIWPFHPGVITLKISNGKSCEISSNFIKYRSICEQFMPGTHVYFGLEPNGLMYMWDQPIIITGLKKNSHFRHCFLYNN